jgi:hypothetical protein
MYKVLGAAQTVTIVLGIEYGPTRRDPAGGTIQSNAHGTPEKTCDAPSLTRAVHMGQHARVFCSELVRSWNAPMAHD